MNHYLLNVGSIKCYVLSDGDEETPKSEIRGMFSEESPAIDAAVEVWTGSTTFSMNCLLIETDGQRILIDVGMGTLDASHSPQLPTRLQELGITPDQITMVVLTHGHGDHIGGVVTDEGQLVYPNARHLMSRLDWDHWTGPAMRPTSEKCLLPLKDQIEKIEPNTPLATGVRTIAALGHTPGHLGIVLESGGQKLMDMVDATHHPIQMAHPDWSPKFDFDPIQAAATRRALFTQAADEGCWLMAYHYAFPAIGTVSRAGEGFEFRPLG